MKALRKKIEEARDFIRGRLKKSPEVAIILGTGLGALTREIKDKSEISYEKIPHFPVSTVPGHKGALVAGSIGEKAVVVFEGRFHYYEGYTLEEITLPVRVAKALGAEYLFVSNAAGGLNPEFRKGDLMLIVDQINLMGVNPLIGPNDEKLGPRFPDMFEPYCPELIKLAREVAAEKKIRLRRGVYLALTGPNLESPAEYRFLRGIGADAVGMSTVPEVIVAVHSQLKVLGISCITDLCFPGALGPVNVAEILRVAGEAEPRLTRLVVEIIRKMK